MNTRSVAGPFPHPDFVSIGIIHPGYVVGPALMIVILVLDQILGIDLFMILLPPFPIFMFFDFLFVLFLELQSYQLLPLPLFLFSEVELCHQSIVLLGIRVNMPLLFTDPVSPVVICFIDVKRLRIAE